MGVDGDRTGRDCTPNSGPREPKGARPPTSLRLTNTTVNDLLLFNLRHPVLLLRRGAMNSNYNIMPVEFIPPPVVQFIPPNVEFIPADPIFIDPNGCIYPGMKVHNVFCFGHRITTIVTHQHAVIHKWISDVRRFNFQHVDSLIVGLAIQWPPGPMDSDPMPAVIQFCIGQSCIIFHLHRAPGIPSSLYGFLSDPDITFVGFRMTLIRRKHQRHWGLVVRKAEDIQMLAARRMKMSMRFPEPIGNLTARFLGFPSMTRPYGVSGSAWDQRELSLEQVTYACADAYLACQLGVRILNTGV